MLPPRPWLNPRSSPQISARLRSTTARTSSENGLVGSMPSGCTCARTLARNWWCPRCEPLTVSWLVSPITEPTAPPSWPMLEWAGPWISPSPASSRTNSSNVRISTSWLSMLVSRCGSAASQSASVATSSTQSAAASSGVRSGISGPSGGVAALTESHFLDPITRSQPALAPEYPSGVDFVDPTSCEEECMGLPGVRGVDHIGFTVPDLEQAHAFLVDVLGCEYLYSLGPFVHEDTDWMAEHLGVHPRTVMRRNSFFRYGDGQAIFEVFSY